MSEDLALIFDVQGYSVHDGPGLRTTIFFSGCPLSCLWCSNPEGMLFKKRIMYNALHCKLCLKCNERCILLEKNCKDCQLLSCVEACPHQALRVCGKHYSINDLMRIFRRDRPFWGAEGGVTFSGGEPLLQEKFLHQILTECNKTHIHTAIETSAYMENCDDFLDIMEHVDFAFIDVKAMNEEKHRKLTSVSNKIILRNIRDLARCQKEKIRSEKLVLRYPVIPGMNDDDQNVEALIDFMQETELKVINILPFHSMGSSKYDLLNLNYEFKDLLFPSIEERAGQMANIAEKFAAKKIQCFIGSETLF
ncbi:MAG: glycyl-radical enzyme activating protein [Oligoflexia bacterium]|nr:glycyl-radical enzyme activating protein [Oligoflexia bacterium]MBF0365484.1 glycyl-radical enzyme activating protein [Oligoflexia bacterium]